MSERPHSDSPPGNAPNSLTIWAVLIPLAIGTFLFFYTLFGPGVLYLGMFAVVVAAIGGLHYWTWGRGMESMPDDDDNSADLMND